MSFIVKAVGSLMQGESTAMSYEYKAQIAQQNAQIARGQGQAAVEMQQRNAARTTGKMVASYGASGVQMDSGSPLDVLADSAAMATLDKLTLQYNTALKAAGYESQSNLDSMGVTTSRTSSYLQAASDFMGGASDSASRGTPIPTFGG